MGEGNQLVKQLADYKLSNNYTFLVLFISSLVTSLMTYDVIYDNQPCLLNIIVIVTLCWDNVQEVPKPTSATMLTIFYMLLLAIADLVADTILIDSSSFTYVSAVNIIIMLAILLALYGIWKELSLCLLPLIAIQVLLGAIMILTLIFSSFIEFHCFLIEACSGGRFLMIAMGSAMFSILYCYCVVIIWLCWKYFRYFRKKTELERTWRTETIDDELDENILIHNLPFNMNFIQY